MFPIQAIRAVQAACKELGRPFLKPEWQKEYDKPGAHFLTGFCYIAAEAMYHLIGGRRMGYKPFCLRTDLGTHWFLKDAQGHIWDPTRPQFRRAPDYESAVGKGFLTRKPSARAQVIMDKCEHPRGVKSPE